MAASGVRHTRLGRGLFVSVLRVVSVAVATMLVFAACGSDDSASPSSTDLAATVESAVAATVFSLDVVTTIPTLEPLTPTATGERETTATPLPQNLLPCPTAVAPHAEVFAPPEIEIDVASDYQAVVTTEKGDIRIQLFDDLAPKTVANFIYLATCDYYDNTTFHRVIEDFIAQAGDPTGTGYGGPGYFVPDEISDRKHDDAGIVSMATAGVDTGGSQFFITRAPAPWLDGINSVFGEVIEGQDVVDSLQERDPLTDPEPGDQILDVEIIEIPPDAANSQLRPCPTAVVPGGDTEPGVTGPLSVADSANEYQAILHTEKGDIRVELLIDAAPTTVNNFVYLALCGYYDGITFHRVIEDFMAQTGDPTATGFGNPGYVIPDEISADLVHDEAGIVSMANAGPGTGSAQFFITRVPTPWLDGLHSIFGRVIEGQEVVDSLSSRDPATATTPGDVLTSVEILVRPR